MAIMFSYSAKTAVASTEQSHLVGETILRLFNTNFENLSMDEQQALIVSIDFAVRKTAHVLEYAVLGFLTAVVMFQIGDFDVILERCRMRMKLYGISAGWGLFYAITDEIHQLYVPGRAAKWQDVALDTLGTLIGVLIMCLAVLLIKRTRKRLAVV